MSRCRKTTSSAVLGPGKVPAEVLEKLLAKFRSEDRKVVVGPGLGLDAAVIRYRGPYLAVTSDPIRAELLARSANDLSIFPLVARTSISKSAAMASIA